MDESLQKCLSFLEKNVMDTLEEELEDECSVHNILEEPSWKNHSSYSYLTTENTTLVSNYMGNSSSLEGNTCFDHITSLKQHDCSQPISYILSFDDSTSMPNIPKKTCQNYHGEQHSKETQKTLHNREPLKRGRTSSKTHDHIMAERKRRENITRMFTALSALIPGLKRMDKATVLKTTIEYVKFLQQRVKDLEQENKKRKIEYVGCFKTNKINVVDNISCTSYNDGLYDKPIKICPEVEARVSGKDVLIRVICEKQKHIVPKLLAKVEAHNLSIVCSNVLAFGNSTLHITCIAKMDHEFSLTVDDLVKILTADLSRVP